MESFGTMDSWPCTSCTHVDCVRSKLCYTLSQLVQLPIRVPDIQRAADLQRVEDIVQHHAGRGTPPVLFGDLMVAQTQDGSAWLVDGQHRWLAYRRLAPMFPEAAVTVEVVRLGVDGAPSMAELFVMVNRSVPVPEYVVKAVMDNTHRHVLDQIDVAFRATYAPFVSMSGNPRRPNVNVSRLLDRLSTSVALQQLSDATAVFEYLRWSNARLLAKDPANAKRVDAKAAKHGGCEPLYLSSDNDDAWMSDPVAIRTFSAHRSAASSTSMPLLPGKASPRKPASSTTSSLPLAVRRAVWNQACGEDAGKGACFCCSGQVTQHTFECGHVQPRSKGGSDMLDNLRVLCRACNRSMGSRDLLEFKAKYFEVAVL